MTRRPAAEARRSTVCGVRQGTSASDLCLQIPRARQRQPSGRRSLRCRTIRNDERGTMKIAQVAPLYEAVPPKLYGGTERIVAYLTDALVDLGHDVTLFACADARTKA